MYMFGFVIMWVVLVLSAGLVREKEQGTIEQLLVTPISRSALIAGKMIPYGVIAALDFVVVTLLARLVFQLPFSASVVLPVGALALLFILSLLGLGALISTLSQTQLQASFSVQMTFLFGAENEPARTPRTVGMVELLRRYNEHQLSVLRRRSEYDLARAKERLHLVEGLIIGAVHADEIVKIFDGLRNIHVYGEICDPVHYDRENKKLHA